METFKFNSFESLKYGNSTLNEQFPSANINLFRKLHYYELASQIFGSVFFIIYFIMFLINGKTFFISDYTFIAIFLVQILTFSSGIVTQKFAFAIDNIEYVVYSDFEVIPKFITVLCDKILVAQMPMYWFVITAFLAIQIAQFSNQNPRGIRFAHVYLVPIGVIVFLISIITPDHMKHFMIVVCFLMWWIYRKHMVAQLYSQEMSAKDISNMRRMNIWLSCQVFRGIACTATYLNALLFAWSTVNFSKDGDNKESNTLPVFVGNSVPMESFSRRPSAISAFSLNNVAPHTPRDSNMLHI
uniref:Protein GMH1 n=1 Tax=Caenorhabditis tropicalis TaxID=1561998 RepID=A0A1I7SYG6_9PELO